MLNYLINRAQGVNVNNSLISRKEIIAGVPRGSIVAHLFFNICINDIFFYENEAFFDQLYTCSDQTLKKRKSFEQDSQKCLNGIQKTLLFSILINFTLFTKRDTTSNMVNFVMNN